MTIASQTNTGTSVYVLQSPVSTQGFDIRNYLDELIPHDRQANRYQCPNCGVLKLNVEPGSGKYQCWGCEDTKAIARILTEPQRDRHRDRELPQLKLRFEHWQELQLSAIPRSLAHLNFRSASNFNEIAKFLGWKGYTHTPGWIVTGIDPTCDRELNVGQFKPDSPLHFPDGNVAKYLTPKNTESSPIAALCLRVTREVWRTIADRFQVDLPATLETDASGQALGFWAWVLDNPQIPLAIAEGAKKAACLLAQGYVAVAVTGVDMGCLGRGGKLVPVLDKLAVRGRPVELMFDADIVVKTSVQGALAGLGASLKRAGCVVSVRCWPLTLGKGVDDAIAAYGSEQFERVSESIAYKNWLKSLESQWSPGGATSQKKPKKPSEWAREIAEEYRDRWIFDDRASQWRIWKSPIWEAVSVRIIEAQLIAILEARGADYNGSNFIADIRKLLERRAIVSQWESADPTRYVNFRNGILNLRTNQLEPHCPSYRFTTVLDRNFCIFDNLPENPLSALQQFAPHFYQFADFATRGNPIAIEKLLATIAGVLRYQFSPLQLFLHLTGTPGTGKGTFARLLEKIVGHDNCESASLRSLTGSTADYEIEKIIDKQLVIFPDEDLATKNLGTIKSLTGGDRVSYRKIYQAPTSKRFRGTIAILSNGAVFAGETIGLERRLCLIAFDRPVTGKRNPQFETLLQAEIPALTSIALTLSEDRIEQLLRGTGETEIAAYRATAWDYHVQVSSVAAWIDERLVAAEGMQSEIGMLYRDYRDFCDRTGEKPLSQKAFSPKLLELCRDSLGWTCHPIRDRRERYVAGVRLAD